ncbi:MAG: FtsH protease activity modulator HflK [Thermodesulfobacteriota bacterium]
MNRKEKTVLVAIAANLLLIVLKFFLASLSGSVALKASAWHSFSDLIPSLVVLTGLILARREDTEATRGISRIENIIAIIVSGFIFYVGIEIVRDVLSRGAQELTNVPLVAVISLASIAITYFMARYQIFVGRETNSPGLIANGTHARVDMYSSIVVVVALMGYIMGFPTLDKIAAAIIVLLILGNGLEVLNNAIKALRRGGFLDLTHKGEELFLGQILQWARRFAIVGVILVAIAYLASGVYTVRWNEEAIVKRFGKPVRQVQAGLHYRLPWPLETVNRVAVADVRMEKVPSSLMLTGDENIVEIEAVVHYQVKDAFAFVYNLSEPRDLVRGVAESALRHQINQNPIDFILTEGKSQVQERAQRIAQHALDQQQSGIQLLTVQLTKDTPPSDVMQAFRDVASAREDKNTYINEALAFQSEIIPKARGEAQKQIEEALAYREEKIRTATGDAQRFLSKLREYQNSRDITERRLYIEALEKTLTNVNKLILDENVQVDNTELWFLKGGLGEKFIKEGKKR